MPRAEPTSLVVIIKCRASEMKMIGSECERRKIGARTLINFNWMRRVGNCSSARCMQSIYFVQLEMLNFLFPLRAQIGAKHKRVKVYCWLDPSSISWLRRIYAMPVDDDGGNLVVRELENVVGDKLRVEVDWRLRDAIWMKFESTRWRCNWSSSG